MADNLSPFLVGGPLGGYKPKREVNAETVKDFTKGQAAGLLGFPADLLQLIAMTANRPIGRPPVEVPLTSDKLAEKFGADPDKFATMMGMVGTPDPGDIARLTTKGLLAQALFHGTPHKFSKFELEKIGTGEGAQAYGHGLYFAESPGVAKSYRSNLADDSKFIEWSDNTPAFELYRQDVQKLNPDLPVSQWNPADDIAKIQDGKKPATNLSDETIEAIRKSPRAPTGHLYEVDIPDETIAKMLDWDAPLSEQPESVRKALKLINKDDISTSRFSINSQDDAIRMTGGDLEVKIFKGENGVIRVESVGERPMTHGRLYRSAVDEKQAIQVAERWMLGDRTTGAGLIELMGKDEAASKALNEAGIPGIRFYDGSSRAKGEGTRNIVVFNPDDITQVKRDGKMVYGQGMMATARGRPFVSVSKAKKKATDVISLDEAKALADPNVPASKMREQERRYLDNLKDQIKRDGLREPLEIDKGVIMEGNHRLAVLEELGVDEIPVIYKGNPDKTPALRSGLEPGAGTSQVKRDGELVYKTGK